MSNTCFVCGGAVSWKNDYSYDEYGAEGDGMVSVYECFDCGAFYEVFQSYNEEDIGGEKTNEIVDNNKD